MGLTLVPPRADPYFDRVPVRRRMADRLAACREVGRPCLLNVHGPAGFGVSCLAYQFYKDNENTIDGPLIWLPGRRSDGGPTPLGELLALALPVLGVAEADLPASDAARLLSWQVACRDRSFMLVIDDLDSVPELLNLIPNDAPRAVVVATSPYERRELRQQRPDFRAFRSDRLPDDVVYDLFRHVLADDADSIEDATLRQLAASCHGVPLHATVLAAQLAGRPRLADRYLRRLGRDELDPAALDDERRLARWLEIAYESLTEEETAAHRRLASLPWSSFPAGAAAAALGLAAEPAEDLLDELVERNLLEFTAADRYEFHQSIRDHARRGTEIDLLTRSELIVRTVNWYVRAALPLARALSDRWWVDSVWEQLTRYCGEQVPTPSRDEALGWLDRELPNLAIAVKSAKDHSQPSLAWMLCVAMWPYLHEHGYYDLWLDTHRVGLEAARESGSTEGVLQVCLQLAGGYLALGELDRAEECCQEALAVARSLGHRIGEQSALEWLGKVAAAREEPQRALARYEESWQVVENASDTEIEPAQRERAKATLRLQRTRAYRRLSEWDTAIGEATAAREYFDAEGERRDGDGDRQNRGKCRYELGRALLGSGDAPAAVAALDGAAELFTADNARRLAADANRLLGQAAAVAGDRDRAVTAYRAALKYYDSVGDPATDEVREALRKLSPEAE